ncbi:MAG: cytidine(C)-cytidine(C)-adenosine (A)]-adding enzyme [Alphaproteobacteria bacterium]|nr:MAG: cytidine(C)-cytidine(C)-adenosine (A)]-adding enzyme [Alphaproteobacteria bacterium]
MTAAPAVLSSTQAQFLADPHLQGLFDLIEAAGGEARVNGGAVRNALLAEPIREVDLSTNLLPEAVTAVLDAGGIKVVATGIEHGTVTAVAGGRGYEITTLREDVETRGRHAVVRFGTDWHADAMRRDFTMNALYCDRNGRLFDPLGGFADLRARRVRFIGSAEARIREDYLRILRFFRFYAWYGDGRPDAEGLKACARNREFLSYLSAERVWHELKRILAAPDPVRAVLWMRTAGVLAVALPEGGDWGIDMLGEVVAIEREQRCPPDPLLRLMSVVPPRLDRVAALAVRLKLSRQERARLEDWAHQAIPDYSVPNRMFARELYRSKRQAVIDALVVELARERTYQGRTRRASALAAKLTFARRWQAPTFPLAGRDLIEAGIGAGPRMGELLARLEQAWVERDFRPGHQELLDEAVRLARGN